MTLHIERRHAIVVPLPPETAFPLFTPVGERLWLAEWQPEFLHPTDGRTETGMVFRTGHGGEETLWSCIEFAPQQHRIRYARVSPETRFAHVAVQCQAAGPGSTRVEVCYTITALNERGAEKLAALTEDAFQASIDDWKQRIEASIMAGTLQNPAP